MASSGFGFLVVFLSVFCYGSYFVPAKKYEIHDGLVFQWYQCSGIMLAGIVTALLRNNWDAPGEGSRGFYVAPEGLLSGLLFQLANITATIAVKMCGLGNYYTIHQVTNLGVTFVVGVFGPQIGLPAKTPSYVGLAALGFVCVLAGMVPIMMMEKEPHGPPAPQADAAERGSCPEPQQPPAASDGERERPPRPTPLAMPVAERQEVGGLPTPGRSRLELLFSQDEPRSPGPASTPAPHTPSIPGLDPSRRRLGASTRQPLPGDFRAFNSWTWDGTHGPPRLSVEHSLHEPASPLAFVGFEGLVIKETSSGEVTPRGEMPGAPQGANEPLLHHEDAHRSQWWKGIALSLLAGALYASMYIPLLPWKARMQAQGVVVEGFDSFFSMCVGLYVSSSVYLLGFGAWKRYRGQRVEKSVLRPALLSGVIYALGALNFLIAMVILPYAIGYALGVGGGLAVSLLWSTVVFGEAKSRHNRRCVLCSFASVMVGVLFLGLSA